MDVMNIGISDTTAKKQDTTAKNHITTAKKRAAAYCRVSTKHDVQDGSYEMQREYYRKKIEDDDNLELVDVYGDHGKSGRSVKGRKELNRLLKDCADGKIDVIYTKSVSRFARNMMECVELCRQLKTQGVSIIFEKEGLNTGTESGEMMLGILATIAQEESVSISQNMKWARRKRYEMGQPMERASYGFRSHGKDHKWEIYEPEAKRVRLAFYMAGMCHNYQEIRAALNALEEKEDTGKVWNGTPVRNLLTNLAYIGDYLSNKECIYADENGIHRGKNRGQADQFYIENHHPAIVSREVFDCVAQLIERTVIYSFRSNFKDEDIAFMQECMKITAEEFAGDPHLDEILEELGEYKRNSQETGKAQDKNSQEVAG